MDTYRSNNSSKKSRKSKKVKSRKNNWYSPSQHRKSNLPYEKHVNMSRSGSKYSRKSRRSGSKDDREEYTSPITITTYDSRRRIKRERSRDKSRNVRPRTQSRSKSKSPYFTKKANLLNPMGSQRSPLFHLDYSNSNYIDQSLFRDPDLYKSNKPRILYHHIRLKALNLLSEFNLTKLDMFNRQVTRQRISKKQKAKEQNTRISFGSIFKSFLTHKKNIYQEIQRKKHPHESAKKSAFRKNHEQDVVRMRILQTSNYVYNKLNHSILSALGSDKDSQPE